MYIHKLHLSVNIFFMLTFNVINPEKNNKSKINGNVFFMFIADSSHATLFDTDLASPIVWGSKSRVAVIMANKLPELSENKSIIIHIYRWIGGKFSLKVKGNVSNNTSEIKKFLRRNGI